MSGQHCENYDVKRETVHFYSRNVYRYCYITNHSMTGPLGNNEVCFPRISMFPCFPRDQSSSVKISHESLEWPTINWTYARCTMGRLGVIPSYIQRAVLYFDWLYFLCLYGMVLNGISSRKIVHFCSQTGINATGYIWVKIHGMRHNHISIMGPLDSFFILSLLQCIVSYPVDNVTF